MKLKIILAWIVFSLSAACASKGTQEASTMEWSEMITFGATIEKAFRPLKDSSTVEAAARMMAQIADEAEKLASSKLPSKLDNDEIKKKLDQLKTDTRALANEIAAGTEDDVIGTDFYKVHDLYQEISDAWKK